MSDSIISGREQRFWIRNRSTLELLASAKLDVFYIIGDHALIIDAKTGFSRATPSERNWQLRTQAVALWHEYPHLVHVRAAIAQSRLVSHFDSTDFQIDDLKRVERELMHAIWRTQQPYAPRVPGTWCRWCRAQADCREAACYSLVDSVNLPDVSDQLGLMRSIQGMTPRQLGFVYSKKSTVETIFTMAKARLQAMPEAELAEAGYKKTPGNNYTPITDVTQAFLKLGELLTDQERTQCIDLVLGRAIDIVATKQKISAKDAKQLVHATLASFLGSKTGNPKLKPL